MHWFQIFINTCSRAVLKNIPLYCKTLVITFLPTSDNREFNFRLEAS